MGVADNTLILVLTIRYGVFVAVGSVMYLFIIHKLEYFVNGYIIGRNVRASVPEMLIAIILGEVAFGLPGLSARRAKAPRPLPARGLLRGAIVSGSRRS